MPYTPRPYSPATPPRPAPPGLAAVAQALHTSPAQLVAPIRDRAHVRPRHEASWLLSQLGHSETAVAQMLRRDRATVRYGRATVELLRAEQPAIAQRLDALLARLRGGAP